VYLPSYQELDKEQDAVLNLPLGGKYLVVGPPGSGKTVVLLHRADRLKKRGERLQLIMYMRVLSRYVRSAAIALNIEGDVTTFHTWFRFHYKKIVGALPMQLEDFVYDWDDVLKNFGRTGAGVAAFPNVLIDEGQDLPKQFYLVANYMAQNLTVFADENQRLTNHQSTIGEIQKFAGIKETCDLKKNYRNSRPIAMLARVFYCGLRSGVPELPDRNGDLPQLRGFERTFDSVDAIAQYERTNTDRHIGVFLPTLALVRKYKNRLTGKTRNALQYYDSTDGECLPQAINFDKPGIFLCAYPSAKGLEFDTVFLPEIQASARHAWNTPEFKMKMYVMISRARSNLFVSWTGERPPNADSFPSNLVASAR
jgi:superfamily I DNA/RNA helicase